MSDFNKVPELYAGDFISVKSENYDFISDYYLVLKHTVDGILLVTLGFHLPTVGDEEPTLGYTRKMTVDILNRIVAVYRPHAIGDGNCRMGRLQAVMRGEVDKDFLCIYKRQEYEELTVAEIEERLGHPIKIVKD